MRFDWNVSGSENPVDTRYIYSSSRNTLTVSDARKEDSLKWFACRSTEVNDAGFSSQWSNQISFDVRYPPDEMPVIQQGTRFSMIENTTAQLSCSVSGGNPLPNITWDCYGTASDNSSGENVTKVVTFTASRRQDRSCFCFMSHPSQNQTVSISIGILFPVSTPTFSIGPVNVSGTVRVIQNKTLSVTCTSSGNPQPSLTWQYVGNTRRDPLIIENIQTSSNGQYTCEAENIMAPSLGNRVNTKLNSSITVLVLYGPEVKPLSKIDIEEGQQLTKACEFTPGNPPLSQVVWSRAKDETKWQNQTLRIDNISRNDASIYTCNVTNTMEPTAESAVSGVDSKTVLLNVWYSSSITLLTFNSKAGSLTVAENDTNINLQCDVDSNPGSAMALCHNSQEILTLSDVKSLKYSLPQANCTDSGRYTCIAYNQYNVQNASVNISLFVKCSPRPSPYVLLIDRVSTGLHRSITLEFSALSYPEPTAFKWFKLTNSSLLPIENTDNTHITTETVNTSLTIVNVTENTFGKYLLTVHNERGVWNQSYYIEAYDKPEPPTDFKSLDEKATISSVTLQWVPGLNGGQPQTFVLQYKKKGTEQWTTVNITHHNETMMTYAIQHLSSGTQYEVVVFAINSIGNSTQSQIITVSTNAADSRPGNTEAVIGGAVGGGTAGVILVAVAVIIIWRIRMWKGNGEKQLALNNESALYIDIQTSQHEYTNMASEYSELKTRSESNFEDGVPDQYTEIRPKNSSKEDHIYNAIESTSQTVPEDAKVYVNLQIRHNQTSS